MSTFNQIHIFDLGGEAGQKDDKNVFDITKGVAIALFVRNSLAEPCIRYASIRGARLLKYQACADYSLADLDWTELRPSSPNYFLVPRTEVGRELYESFWSVGKLFVEGTTGILTGRDRLSVAETERALRDHLEALKGTADDREIEARFDLDKVDHWSLSDARKLIREEGIKSNLIRKLAYRPFDTQYYYDHDALVFRRRHKVMQQMTGGQLGLAVCRLTKGGAWCHCMIAGDPSDDSYVSDKSKERAYLYPLYTPSSPKLKNAVVEEPQAIVLSPGNENLSADFRAFLDSRYDHHYAPEEILGYVYAVLHAPSYRLLYAEFLSIDFPRVPFPEAAEDFETLSSLGWALVQAHLLRGFPRRGLALYRGKGDHVVESVRYSPDEQMITINKTQFFKPVPETVWEFRIGSHQVLDKYLKSRKGHTLSLDEINHIAAIADSLAFTIEQMVKIDSAYTAAFPDRG